MRPVPTALPDVPADGRRVGVAARPDHGDAGGPGGPRGDGRDVRPVHGSVPRLPRVRGRLSVARALRTDDGSGANADRTAPASPCEVPSPTRPRSGASLEEAHMGGGRAHSARAPVHAPAHPGLDPAGWRRAVRAAPTRHRASWPAPRDRRSPLWLRAGPM